jgi:hypothetical protein
MESMRLATPFPRVEVSDISQPWNKWSSFVVFALPSYKSELHGELVPLWKPDVKSIESSDNSEVGSLRTNHDENTFDSWLARNILVAEPSHITDLIVQVQFSPEGDHIFLGSALGSAMCSVKVIIYTTSSAE